MLYRLVDGVNACSNFCGVFGITENKVVTTLESSLRFCLSPPVSRSRLDS